MTVYMLCFWSAMSNTIRFLFRTFYSVCNWLFQINCKHWREKCGFKQIMNNIKWWFWWGSQIRNLLGYNVHTRRTLFRVRNTTKLGEINWWPIVAFYLQLQGIISLYLWQGRGGEFSQGMMHVTLKVWFFADMYTVKSSKVSRVDIVFNFYYCRQNKSERKEKRKY